MNRRGFLGILAGAVAAPIVVRSGLLMPVKPVIIPATLTPLGTRLFYSGNTTYTRYSAYDLLNITPADVISAVSYDIRQVARSVTGEGPLLRHLRAIGHA